MQHLLDSLIRLLYILVYKAILCLWFFTRPTINGVFIAVWHQNRILIVKNSYRKWFIVPCGGIKRNENLADAAVRELYEEAGIKADKNQIKFAGRYAQRYKYALDNGHFFEVELTAMPAVRIDNREVIWAEFLRPAEALALQLNPLVRLYLTDRDRR